jgi:hypothetical protein
MIPIAELWEPILLSTVIVWIASALVWMALPHHKSEYAAVSDEEATRNSLRGIGPGLYRIPHAADYDDMKDSDKQKKFEEGPVGFLTVMPNGVPAMGGRIVQSFIFFLVVSVSVSVIVAYVASRTLPSDTHYLMVFRVTGTIDWLAYGFGSIPESIWFGRPWGNQLKTLIDGLCYGLLTAGVFGWLWPRGM